MIDALPLLLGPEGYQISRSVRLRSSATASFSRTPASASNQKTWTWSGWVKRGSIDDGGLFSAGTSGSNYFNIRFQPDYISVVSENSALVIELRTTPLYRDPSAWYHIVFALDTTQATSTNRAKLYVNGVQVTAFFNTLYPSLNLDMVVNSAVSHYNGRAGNGAINFDGYLTEVNFIDGQALTPSSFGETNLVTGVWQPKKYAGTYGTNGFYLNFSDNSAATAAAIGKDNSGNGNNWTPNNISVTAGVTYDSMLDVPTQWADGGNGRGNYAVLNPLWASDSAGNTYSSANLILNTNGSSSSGNARCTIALPSSGKFYCEMKPTNFVTSTSGTSRAYYGILAASSAKQIAIRTESSGSSGLTSSAIFKDGVLQGAITTLSLNDILGFAIDCDASTVQIFVNNTSVYSGSYSVTSEPYFFGFSGDSGTADRNSTTEFNFGQRPFAYTPPSGFKALNTLNLPAPTILKGNQYFDATLYTANASSQTISSLQFQPDFLWIKSRSGAYSNILQDSVRGATAQLFSNLTNAEFTGTDRVQSFTSNGWTMGADAAYGVNAPNGATQVAWSWKEGPTQGFDIVTYTGNGAAPQNVAHNLGVAPSMIIVKRRNSTSNWWTYAQPLHAINAGSWLYLNLTNGVQTTANAADAPFFKAQPTSSTFPVSGDGANVNTATYVAYLFSEVAGFSRMGSYTGNGSADGPFVFCGFRPRWIMVKRTDSTGVWTIMDAARSTNNVMTNRLYADLSNAEDTDTVCDFLSNGFKVRGSLTSWNASGGTYIFMAFAETPFRNSLAR
jgi:hypothetical protein